MSCYEWERGTIKLSVKEYNRVKREMIEAIKKHQVTLYTNAIKLYEKMIAAAKGKRDVDWKKLHSNLRLEVVRQGDFLSDRDETDLDPDDKFYPLYDSENKRPLKPKKKDYAVKIERKDLSLYFSEAQISFNDKNKTIFWSVSENNHAREWCHNHTYAKALFRLLGTVKWTRGTGGTIVGNDEYNQDSDYEGGGGNYVTMSFGKENKNSSYKLAY